MIDITALRKRLADGENPARLAESIMDEPEIAAAYLRYECGLIADGHWPTTVRREYMDGMLNRLESWRKGDKR